MNASRRVEIRSQKRLFDDFFKIDELIVVHQRYDGSMSGVERRLVFERGDAVAVLLFDADARSVVLVSNSGRRRSAALPRSECAIRPSCREPARGERASAIRARRT